MFLLLGLLLSGCEKVKDALQGAASAEVPEYVLEGGYADRAVGWTMVRKTELKGMNMTVDAIANGSKFSGTGSLQKSKQEVIQVLGKERLRLTVQRDDSRDFFQVPGFLNEKIRNKGVLVGKYIILEKKGDAWTASFESGQQASKEEAEQMELLIEEMAEIEQDYGSEPRKVGDEWAVAINGAKSGEKVSLNFVFEAVEEFRGGQCAVLGVKGVYESLKAESGSMEETRFAVEGKIYRSLALKEDILSELSGEFTVTTSPSIGVTVEVTGPLSVTVESEVTLPAQKAVVSQ